MASSGEKNTMTKPGDGNSSFCVVDKELRNISNGITKSIENGVLSNVTKSVNGIIEDNPTADSEMNGDMLSIDEDEGSGDGFVKESNTENSDEDDDCGDGDNDNLLDVEDDDCDDGDNDNLRDVDDDGCDDGDNDNMCDVEDDDCDDVVTDNLCDVDDDDISDNDDDCDDGKNQRIVKPDKIKVESNVDIENKETAVNVQKEEILDSELDGINPDENNDVEGKEVEEIFKNQENDDGEDMNESKNEIIPSPIEVNKRTRLADQFKKITKLREDLRCEEAALTLLRKLVDSQQGKSVYKSKPSTVSSLHPKQLVASKPNAPPKIVNQPLKQISQPVQKYYIQVGNQLVPAPPPSPTPVGTVPYQFTNGITNNAAVQPPYPQQPSKPVIPKQTPEQKQNAAKAALRRQLEQTLLQIPPPRPPPADWKVVPNVNSMDFMMLVGLDEVVDMILDLDSKPTLKAALEQLSLFNPRICSQCKVDFSPSWKITKDPSRKGLVICERCSLQNIKKELKAEHTTRLKSAFLKALKQEQEIEEKIKAGEDVNIGIITGNEKSERNAPSPQQHTTRIASPKTNIIVPSQPVGNHVAITPEHRSHHQSSGSNHHRHQVVQHYPHHNSLVQQLHHQHIQQQNEVESPSSRHSSRWHPYMPSSSSSHHREHRELHNIHHRSYVSSSNSSENSPHQEYYVVHHPQHAGVRYVNR